MPTMQDPQPCQITNSVSGLPSLALLVLVPVGVCGHTHERDDSQEDDGDTNPSSDQVPANTT